MALVQQLPAPIVEEDRALAISGSTSSSLTESFAALSAGLQKAVTQMGADDISLEVDAGSDRLRVRFRAYKHRRDSGSR
jgi:hypothetical protein